MLVAVVGSSLAPHHSQQLSHPLCRKDITLQKAACHNNVRFWLLLLCRNYSNALPTPHSLFFMLDYIILLSRQLYFHFEQPYVII